MDQIKQNKRQHVIHVNIRPTLKQNSETKHLQNQSMSSDNNMTLTGKEKPHNQQHLYFPVDFDHKNISERSLDTSKQDRSNQMIPIVSNKKNLNRITPSDQPSNFLEKHQNSILRDMKSKKKQKRTCCGLPLWSCILLPYLLLVVLAIIAAVIISIWTANQRKTSSTSTSTVISTTSVTTTSTTSTTSTTAPPFCTCSNMTVKANWDYNGNDIINNGSLTFASCCAWCMTVPLCVTFTFNPLNICYAKYSTGTGGKTLINATAAACL